MNWYERRSALLVMAATAPGWGCVRLPGETHIGRILMHRQYQAKAGFYRCGTSAYSYLAAQFAADQKRRTMALPK